MAILFICMEDNVWRRSLALLYMYHLFFFCIFKSNSSPGNRRRYRFLCTKVIANSEILVFLQYLCLWVVTVTRFCIFNCSLCNDLYIKV